MPLTDTIQRAAPVALSILDDPRVTDRLSGARKQAGKAKRARGRRPTRRSPLQLAALAAQDLAGATFAAKARAERERKKRRRATQLKLGAAGSAVGAAAFVLTRRSNPSPEVTT